MAAVCSADSRSRSTRKHLGAFAREAQRGGAAVAQTLSRGLAGTDDDCDLSFETHGAVILHLFAGLRDG